MLTTRRKKKAEIEGKSQRSFDVYNVLIESVELHITSMCSIFTLIFVYD